jgi:alpha-glucosidase
LIYEIFPDRFAIGKPRDSTSKLALPAYQSQGMIRSAWSDLPRGENDFFGGDLRGILDHLDYVQGLGATGLYLTPIFTAPSNHKYDTLDYFTIDPQFGDDAALKDLIAELHRRGMKLTMDAVFNHVGEKNPWFLAAQRGERPYRDFFTFDAGGGYDCWWGFSSLPELRLDNPLLQELLFRGSGSVLQRYLGWGVDGWRFDTALDLGLGIGSAMREAVGTRFPDATLIGETMAFGAEWVRRGHFHGVMNYYLRDALMAWLGGSISARQMSRALSDYYDGYGHEGSVASWNVLSTHDTARLRTLLPDDRQRALAIVSQFTLPGEPVVYYGEEIGMEGGEDPDCRRPMIWDEARWDARTLALYKKLAALRSSRPELREGRLIVLGDRLDGNAIAYLRHTDVPNQTSIVIINAGKTRLQQQLFIPYSHLYATLPLKDAIESGPRIRVDKCAIAIDLPPESAAIYVPDDVDRKNYTFFKPRNLGSAWP